MVYRSPLFDVPDFEIVTDTPAKYLHSVCLGVGKSIIKLIFNVGDTWPRETKRKLSSTAELNILLLSVKTVREFSRRIREIDLSVLKGQEIRNIILFLFSPDHQMHSTE